jgi:hypothetical protein
MLFDSAAGSGAEIVQDPGARAALCRTSGTIERRGCRGGQAVYLSETCEKYYFPHGVIVRRRIGQCADATLAVPPFGFSYEYPALA